MKVRIELNNGIVTGDTKRLLEQYNTGLHFAQRKSYDEYYPSTVASVDMTLEVLSLISDSWLTVEVQNETIIVSERY